ncbi:MULTISPECIES: putative lipid II flippase FtsW [Thalassospira]|jgi:cell division protein FtsW|uniref:Probable peptidoglycan glycosyltransferase FtsW n=1 Tax=Thalassospira profundimaris TaxID=502049 RepID=A0A367VKB3_9PROT|nr:MULTISPECIES: putative lipid II flippase FtsW [Thalassospira]MBR9899612.1 putative lipid II flippase FtsW [Rhodospirillales bacterium]MCS5575692.1 putative lipid II flippase FtsW [Pseudomonadales bacterium]KZB70703.1 cell division protein FtsW [Thalassospira sp. MCCC 1A01148]MBO6805627.1 putative lipid II flippase FtsW [Thalassospira sp.]MBO6841247.1 putative lipid II flippase FtsW [Thalassospira sp.]|tara:strand:- start:12319 stop:13458 length:1140 start_codon:yes stop_codon:yes gene_type:complete
MKSLFGHNTHIAFSRADTSVLGIWWWTVDRWLLAAIILLMGIGALLVMSASPPVADRINVDSFHFVTRQFVFLGMATICMFGISLLPVKWVRRLASFMFLGVIFLLIITPFIGSDIKGAVRWINVAGINLQPSEFLKPAFAVVIAWMFAEGRLNPNFPGYIVSSLILAVCIFLLMIQPDFGQTVVITSIWSVQIFLAGLPIILVFCLGLGAVGLAVTAYLIMPHVQSRVDRFLDPASGDSYQIERSMEAFMNGGIMGRGPGEGWVKNSIPDAHSDFIFAVAGEEFGLLFCVLVVGVFTFIIMRGLSRLMGERNLFVVLAVTGILVQFGLQAVINMASTLQLVPPKGMTLPFVSYGGSATIGIAIGMGFVLALTRKRPGE